MTEPDPAPPRLHTHVRRYGPALAIAALAGLIAWGFVFVTLHHTASMGLPLDDSYIYLTYAKQAGRAQPFTYFPGGGYSAGSTSVLWPLLLAPFWALGARGHALVWVSFGMCTLLYAAVGVGCYRVVRRLVDGNDASVHSSGATIAGMCAAVLTLSLAPFAWTSLSGMEVAFAAALLVATVLLLVDAPRTGPPRVALALCLAATSLSRPEATLLVIAIACACAFTRVRGREWRAAAWWLVPLAAPAAWLAANKLLAGNFFPNTGVAKSHFYLPGFTWHYWIVAIGTLIARLARGLFWDPASPLVWPRLIAIAWLAGAVRVVLWARRERRYLLGALVIAAPLVLMVAVIASSGLWNFQNYRYIAPAFPLLMITVGFALAPPARVREPRARHAWSAIAAAITISFALAGWSRMRADMLLFAQGASDTNTQVVAIGRYLNAKQPDASVMFHDAGAIAYYGDGRVFDMLGLVTNYQAGIANNGPGARFEFLESLPPARRPTLFAYYPGWMGTPEFYGDVLFKTPIPGPFEPRRLAGDVDMQVISANWDHVGTGERPLTAHDGWTIVEQLDIADLVSEQAHAWHGELGERVLGDPTARWSLVEREIHGHGLVIDGGRTIRARADTDAERFAIDVDPSKPTRLLLRTGGQRTYPFHETIDKPVELRILADDGRELARATIPPPDGTFRELAFELPAGALHEAHAIVRVVATSPYRAFHWFVLQPT